MKKNGIYIQKILIFLLVFIIMMSGILIGSPARNNVRLIYILVDILAIIYIIQKGIKKEKIINEKIDILILILCLSSCIPIIFNTYTSLSDSFSFILKYNSVFFIYLITKDLAVNNKKIINYLIYIILLISVVLVILGIDRVTYHCFKPVVEFLNITNFYQEEIRLTSLFSYANSFAAMAVCGMFLALGQSLMSSKTVIKGINQIVLFILFVGLILSLSRMMYLIMGLMSFIYLFINKEKNRKMEIIENIISTLFLSIIYSTILVKLLESGKYVEIWIYFIIFSLVSFITVIFFKYINIKIFNISKRKIIKISLLLIILIGIIFIIVIKVPENLVMFNTENSEKTIERHISKINGNEKYILNFKINAISINNKEIFQIKVLERDEYWNNLNSTIIQFGSYNGNKEIVLNTHPNTTDIYLIFSSIEVSNNIKLEIINFEINGKEEYLNYKFLPYDFVGKMKNINFQTQSVIDRGTYIKDALKLVKDNWLFGIGGDGWHYRYPEVQEYNYSAREVHSYPIQIFLEFGIVRICFLLHYSYYFI